MKLNIKNDVVIPEGLEIGSDVTYSPSGTYTWPAQYASAKWENTYSTINETEQPLKNDVTLNSANGQQFNITNWKVLSIDEKNSIVELISTAPTVGKVRLFGAPGYNNGVYLLNEACDRLYGNGVNGNRGTIVGRSINMEDIEKRMTDTAIISAHSYKNTESNGTSGASFGNQVTSPYSGNNKYYPLIYVYERNSVINGNINNNGLLRNEQDELYERTEKIDEKQTSGSTPSTVNKTATDGYVEVTTNFQPYQTDWENRNKAPDFMKTAFKAANSSETDGTENLYYTIFIIDSSTHYWIASRYINTFYGRCHFGIQRILDGAMYAMRFLYSDALSITPITNSITGTEEKLRPIVTLPVSLIEKDNNGVFKVIAE